MNKEKAIQIIESDFKMGCGCCIHPSEVGWCDNKCQSKKAINMAIEALSKDVVSREEYEKVLIECGEVKTKLGELQQTTKVAQGKWIKTVDGNGWDDWYVLKCPFCGATIEDKYYRSWEYNFCPHCGVRMKVGE